MKYNYEQTRNDYETPPELVFKALEITNKGFDCDVCCSRMNIPAKNYYLEGETEGLTTDWMGLNWCNPPFYECSKWIKKAFIEQQKGNSTMMLIPVRTETKYWHDFILFNSNVDIYWLRKGYAFINPDTEQPCGVFKNALALVYFKGVKNE